MIIEPELPESSDAALDSACTRMMSRLHRAPDLLGKRHGVGDHVGVLLELRLVLLQLRFQRLRFLGVLQQLRPRGGAIHACDGPLRVRRPRCRGARQRGQRRWRRRNHVAAQVYGSHWRAAYSTPCSSSHAKGHRSPSRCESRSRCAICSFELMPANDSAIGPRPRSNSRRPSGDTR